MPGLLSEVIEAHGGRERFSQVSEIRAHVLTGGLMPSMKRMKLADYGLRVGTDRPAASFDPYPRLGCTGSFYGDSVQVADAQGAVISRREHPRRAFFGASGLRRKLRWDELDSLYFAGYAMWNYLNLPFLLEDERLRVSEGESIDADGERWRRLDVRFPEGFPTHSARQSFFFDPEGLLRRHDYSPDVVSRRAGASHLSDGHREVQGIVFPTARRVVPRGPGGRPMPGPAIIKIELDSIVLA